MRQLLRWLRLAVVCVGVASLFAFLFWLDHVRFTL